MSKEEWWETPGVIVDLYLNNKYDKTVIVKKENIHLLIAGWSKIVPRGTPFDCLPDWAVKITLRTQPSGEVAIIYSGLTRDGNTMERIIPNWRRCPEAWKNFKEDITFPVTPKLRELLEQYKI